MDQNTFDFNFETNSEYHRTFNVEYSRAKREEFENETLIKEAIEEYEKRGFLYLQDDQEFGVSERIRLPSGKIKKIDQIDKTVFRKLEFGDKEQRTNLEAKDYYNLLYELNIEERT